MQVIFMDDELFRVKKDIDAIKDSSISANELAKALNSLTRIFEEASEDLKMDTHDAVLVSEKLEKIQSRLEKVEIQNEKIAKGIVALADMLEEMNSRVSRPPQQYSRPMSSAPPSPVSPGSPAPRPLPSYNMPKQADEKKKPFLSF
jgi:DNA repair ATPase RecN